MRGALLTFMSGHRLQACLVAALAAIAGCSAANSFDEADSELAADEGTCAMSSLATSVATAARGASSTTPRIVTKKNRLVGGPIVGGEAYAEAMTSLIRSAKREVIFEVFLLEDGWLAGRLRDAVATLDPAIPVYVHVTSDLTRREFADHSGSVTSVEQATADRVLAILDPTHQKNVIVGAWGVSGIANGINHDKNIVVDRERAIVSNINLELPSDPSARNPESGQTWYQMAVRVDGEVARTVADEAASAWQRIRAVATSRADSPLGNLFKAGRATLPELPPLALPAAFDSACLPIVNLGREVHSKDESSANAGFIALFANARRDVRMITPNLNAWSALAALVDSTKRSDVSIVVSKGFTETLESLPGQGGGNEAVVTRRLPKILAERGGDPCKMHVRYYASPEKPGRAVYGEAEGASHAKYASADGEVMVIGSQNMDTQSWAASREFSIAIDDKPTTAAFDAEWKSVWERSECAFECGGCAR